MIIQIAGNVPMRERVLPKKTNVQPMNNAKKNFYTLYLEI